MKILILEDETLASERIVKMLSEIDASIEIVGEIKSVQEGTKWFEDNPEPDLIISDIRLLDGLSFDLFKNLKIETPIIFTTAYSEYAIRSFDFHTVDYLMKPISQQRLTKAIEKLSLAEENIELKKNSEEIKPVLDFKDSVVAVSS